MEVNAVTLHVVRNFNPIGDELYIFSREGDGSLGYVARITWEPIAFGEHIDPTLRVVPMPRRDHPFTGLADDLSRMGFIHSNDSAEVIRAKDAHIRALEAQIENLKLSGAWMVETIGNLQQCVGVSKRPEIGPTMRDELLCKLLRAADMDADSEKLGGKYE